METAAAGKAARTNKDGNTERVIEHEVDVDLEQAELVALGGEIADLELGQRELEQDLRDESATRRKAIKERKALIKEKCEQRRAKKTKVRMQCLERVEYPNRVAVYRLDLPGIEPGDERALVATRALTSAEVQEPLLDVGAPTEKAGNDAGTPPGTVVGGRKKGGGKKKGASATPPH